MTRILLLVHGLLMGAAITGVLLALAAGHVLSAQPDLLPEAPDCKLPCWNGIRPGQTSLRDAAIRLLDQGYVTEVDLEGLTNPTRYIAPTRDSVCKVDLGLARGSSSIQELTLWFCQPLNVGYAMTIFGAPETILPLSSILIFRDTQGVAILRHSPCQQALSPRSPVSFIILTSGTFYTGMEATSPKLPWRGFLPLWRYERLFSDIPLC